MEPFPGKPPHYQREYSIYFLTFCVFKRLPILHFPGIPEFLIEELYFYERKIQKLVAYTIMPEHVHLIVEVKEANSLTQFLHAFKSYTSNEIKKRITENRTWHYAREPDKNKRSRRLPAVEPSLPRSPTSSRLLPERIWQPGTMDHCIRMYWESNDYQNHLSYLFYNSQKHLGIAPKDFPYHNFKEFVQRGFYGEDFCSVSEDIKKKFMIYE